MTKRRKHTGPLDTSRRVRREMGRCYREARNGELEAQELRSFVYALSEIRKAISESEFELRLDAVEDRVAQTNGAAGHHGFTQH